MPIIPADDVAERGTKAWRQQVNANRAFMANQLWTAQAQGQNLSDPDVRAAVMAQHGVGPEKGGGLHMYNLFQGNLGAEGFGMSSPERDIPYALEAYMPDWRFNLDRAIQGGMPRDQANAQFLPQGVPHSAGYPSGGGGAAPTGTGTSYAPQPGPNVFGHGSTESAMGGVPMGMGEDDAWRRARDMFQSGRKRRTLGEMSVGGY